VIKKSFPYEERSLYKTVLDSDNEKDLVIEAEGNRGLTTTDLAMDKIINKKCIHADTIERILNKHGQ
jgi:hypothetical protein